MPVLSKFFAGTLGFKLLTAECHEISHVWNPSCYLAIWDALWDGIVFCVRTYGTLYIFNSLIKTKGNWRRMKWKRVLKDTLRSSIFLNMNMVMFLSWLCQLRKLLGFAIWPTVSFVNSFLGSIMAIFIENEKRRPMLALYMLNLASESVFRQLVHRNYLKPLPQGQCLLFSIGLAYLFYATKQPANTNTYLASVLDLTHGHGQDQLLQTIGSLPDSLKGVVSWLRQLGGSYPLCSHHHSCLSNALEPAAKNFAFGVVFSSMIKVMAIIKSPRKLKSLVNMKMLKLPVFLATMPFVFQSSQCLLNRVFNKKLHFTPSIAGAASGLAMLVWPSTNIAMYTLWKAIEIAYIRLAEKYRFIPMFKHGDALLYALAAGYLIGLAVVEPQVLRKSYYKFLCDVTGNRMLLFNRRLIDKLGFQSNQMFEQYYANLHPLSTTINPDLYMTVKNSLAL